MGTYVGKKYEIGKQMEITFNASIDMIFFEFPVIDFYFKIKIMFEALIIINSTSLVNEKYGKCV